MSWIRHNLNNKQKQKQIDIKRDNINTDTKRQIIDHIDAILYINLEHRPDRNEHCLNEIRKIDPLLTKTHRINAVYNNQNHHHILAPK